MTTEYFSPNPDPLTKLDGIEQQLFFHLLVVRSSTYKKEFHITFTFRGLTYAITTITLLPTTNPMEYDLTISLCLDTGYDISLVDRSWLLK